MLKLNDGDNFAIWINHQELINASYQSSISNSEFKECYTLKIGIFDFHPKTPEPSAKKCETKFKRKRSKLDVPENFTLRSRIENLLLQINKKSQDSEKCVEEDMSQRVWEDDRFFPQMKGANNTFRFELFSHDNFQYVIPPQSRFFNHDVTKIDSIFPYLEAFDFIVMDPPWRNKYIRRIKRIKKSFGYQMMDNNTIQQIPLQRLVHENSLIIVWCTNSEQHKSFLVQQLFPTWNLRLLHTILWIKLNTSHELIGELREDGSGKQPYETLYIGCHKDSKQEFKEIKQIHFLMSIPSIIHSHKPPLLEIFRQSLPQNPKCLELFARYLHPQFTSIGLEVLKLMDLRLYQKTKIK